MGIAVDGQSVDVGDVVCFKSDVEQSGRIKAYQRSRFGGYELTLQSACESGFSGDYIGGHTTTVQHSFDCWVE